MTLFYNPSWMETEEHLMLFLAKVPDPKKIKTWDDLQPYLISEIAELIVMEDRNVRENAQPISLRMIEDLLHPDLTLELDRESKPRTIADVILNYPPYLSQISQLQRRIKANQMNPKRMPPDLLQDVYNERSLGSILVLL